MYLIAVDIGNTTCEFVIFQEDIIIDKFFIPTNITSLRELESKIEENKEIFINSNIVVSSVVPLFCNELQEFFTKLYSIDIFIISHKDYSLLVKRKYGDISEVGMDIICKSAWLNSRIKKEGLILDIGTATVLQYVDKEGYLDRVAISLGLSTIYKNLQSSAALLPLISPKKAKNVLGRNTEDAMSGGIYWGYIGGINQMVEMAKKETSCNNIFLTGGLSYLVKDDLKFECQINNDLIFEGIKIIYENNLNKIKEKNE